MLPRSAWTKTARPVGKLTPMDPAEVRGVCVHYTGSKSPLGSSASLETSCRRLEEERVFHTQGRGWSDIAYGAAIDVEGRVFDCRGIGYRSAANGNATVNRQYGAVTWLIGVGDQPTPAMIEAFREWRRTVWLAKFPDATAVVGHRDLYSTECPGDPAYALVRSGALTSLEDDMSLTPAEIDAIATKARDLVLGAKYGQVTLAAVIGETRLNAARAASVADALDKLLGQVSAGAVPAGTPIDYDRLADAVVQAFGRRITRQ